MEHERVAARAAQRVRVGARVDEHGLGPVRDLTDGERRGGRDLADDHRDLVALDQALGLGGGGLRIDRILDHELDLAAQDAAGGVDLLGREPHAHLGEFSERTEEPGDRREMADPDHVGLRLDDGGHSDAYERGGAGSSLEERTAGQIVQIVPLPFPSPDEAVAVTCRDL